MAEIALGGKRGKGRSTQVSNERYEFLNEVGWRVKKFPSGYEQIIREGAGGWDYPLSRVVLELKLRRPLTSTEHAHHKNEDTFDNRDENLELLTKGEHRSAHNRLSRSHERAKRAATLKRRADPNCGAYESRKNRWSAFFQGTYLGMFPTQEEAIACYRKAVAEGIEAARVIRRDPHDENRGVRQRPSGRWQALFRCRSLGMYETKADAIDAYRQAVADSHR